MEVDGTPFEVGSFRNHDGALDWLGMLPNPTISSPNHSPVGHEVLNGTPANSENFGYDSQIHPFLYRPMIFLPLAIQLGAEGTLGMNEQLSLNHGMFHPLFRPFRYL
jgi:hypothetical protein